MKPQWTTETHCQDDCFHLLHLLQHNSPRLAIACKVFFLRTSKLSIDSYLRLIQKWIYPTFILTLHPKCSKCIFWEILHVSLYRNRYLKSNARLTLLIVMLIDKKICVHTDPTFFVRRSRYGLHRLMRLCNFVMFNFYHFSNSCRATLRNFPIELFENLLTLRTPGL